MRREIVFQESIRSILFDRYRERFRQGDWIVKLDADEVYACDPRRWVPEHVRWFESAIYVQWYYFRLTDRDVADWEAGRETLADRDRPIEQRRRYFQVPEFSEWRMFKYRRTMEWAEQCATPWNMGYPTKARLPIMHFPHRDPEQMLARHRLRRAAIEQGGRRGVGIHWAIEDWRREVVALDGQADEADAGRIEYTPDGTAKHQHERIGTKVMKGLDGPVLYREGDEALPAVEPLSGHLPRGGRRIAMRLLHPWLVPFLDRRRRKFTPGWQGLPAGGPTADSNTDAGARAE